MLILVSVNKVFQFDSSPIQDGWCSETSGELSIFYSGFDCNEPLEKKTLISVSGKEVKISRSCSAEIPLFYFLSAESELYISDSVNELQQRVKQPVDIDTAYEYIYSQFLPKDKTLFSGIYQLLNLEEVKFSIEEGKVSILRNDKFFLPMVEMLDDSEKNIALQLRQEIGRAHKQRMGTRNALFLSGGIDSQVMAVTLSRDLGLGKSLQGLHFHVKGASQNELLDARNTATNLDIDFTAIEVDPNKKISLDLLLKSNAPYIGSISISTLLGEASLSPDTTVYTGQDTRLHTPTFKGIDENFISFLSKPLIGSLISRFSTKILEGYIFSGGRYDSKIYRNLSFLSQVNNVKHYLANRYFKISKFPFQDNRKQSELLGRISSDLKGLDDSSMRSLFNGLVAALWRRQYLYDINYMQSCTSEYGLKLAAPFYDGSLADFSAQLPYELVTRLTSGRSGHGAKKVSVNKYLLRSAYQGELDDSLIYRDKAVCLTSHMFFNGGLVKDLEGFMNDDWVSKNESSRMLYLHEIQTICSYKHKNWREQDHWLMMVVFNSLIVYKSLRELD